MKRARPNRFVFSALLGALAVLSTFAVGLRQPSAGGVTEIQMTAKKYEFNPSTITVREGERVRLIITALDRDHGFALHAFGINEELKKGVPATVEFTASQAGTFPFHCSVFCGLGHRHMKGKLVVKGGLRATVSPRGLSGPQAIEIAAKAHDR